MWKRTAMTTATAISSSNIGVVRVLLSREREHLGDALIGNNSMRRII